MGDVESKVLSSAGKTIFCFDDSSAGSIDPDEINRQNHIKILEVSPDCSKSQSGL